jgi:hypothetical protein
VNRADDELRKEPILDIWRTNQLLRRFMIGAGRKKTV